MPGPSLPWLQAFGPLADMPAYSGPAASGVPPQGPMMSQAPPPELPPAGPPPPPPAPLPPPPAGPNEDPAAMMSRAAPSASQGSPAAVPVAMTAQGAPPDGYAPPVAFRQTGGGSPAREVYARGPNQSGLLEASFVPGQEAAERIGQRGQAAAEREASFYDQQAEQYLKQQEAMQRVQSRRQHELAQLQADYSDTIQQLGNSKVDGNRLWANSSTLEKIGTVALAFLGGMTGGTDGIVARTIEKRIQDDVDLQKFDYEKGLNVAKGQQTAYGMAMERYGSEDAAYHAATAAAQMAAASKVAGMAAQWKGVDAQNQADALISQLQSQSLHSSAEGWKYLPATAGGQYRAAYRGVALPAPMTGAQANAMAIEHNIKPYEKGQEEVLKGGIQSTIEGEKAGYAERKAVIERGKDMAGRTVVLPTGEQFVAPSEKDAQTLRGASKAMNDVQRDVEEALKIRQDASWLVSPEKYGRLNQIQKKMELAVKDEKQLGQLTTSDLEIIKGLTADLTSVNPNVENKLMNFRRDTAGSLSNLVKTMPGASVQAQGGLPDSYEKKK